MDVLSPSDDIVSVSPYSSRSIASSRFASSSASTSNFLLNFNASRGLI